MFMFPFASNRPGISLFLTKQGPFPHPIRSTIAPKMKENLKRRTGEGTKPKNMKANQSRRNRESEDSIREWKDTKVGSNAAKRSLKDKPYRLRRKTKTRTAKGDN
jgi:hypothetical protein